MFICHRLKIHTKPYTALSLLNNTSLALVMKLQNDEDYSLITRHLSIITIILLYSSLLYLMKTAFFIICRIPIET